MQVVAPLAGLFQHRPIRPSACDSLPSHRPSELRMVQARRCRPVHFTPLFRIGFRSARNCTASARGVALPPIAHDIAADGNAESGPSGKQQQVWLAPLPSGLDSPSGSLVSPNLAGRRNRAANASKRGVIWFHNWELCASTVVVIAYSEHQLESVVKKRILLRDAANGDGVFLLRRRRCRNTRKCIFPFLT